jgi:ABC-type branched-subunit amino acid transport system substrate-binding protein
MIRNKSWCLLLRLAVAAAVLVATTPHLAAGAGTTAASVPSYRLGGLFPLGGVLRLGGIQRAAAAEMAVEAANEHFAGAFQLTLDISDTDTTPSTGVLAAYKFMTATPETGGTAAPDTGGPVVALLGAASSGVSKAVALLTPVFTTPQLSYSSTSPDLSTKSIYPYFCRVVQSDAAQSDFVLKLMRTFGYVRPSASSSFVLASALFCTCTCSHPFSPLLSLSLDIAS